MLIAMAIAGCTDTADNGSQQGPQQIGGAGGAGGVMAVSGGAGGVGGVGGAGAGGTAGGAGAAGTMNVGGQGGTAGTDAAGTGGTAGTMVAGGEGGGGGMEMLPDPDAGMMPPEREDLGMGDGQDVVTIGDSWMSYFLNSGGIEGALDRAGTDYRHYGVAGTTLGSSIPPQWDSAKRAGADIKTVIMTGGGNDIMFGGGCATKESCEMAVQMIADMLDELWTQMSNDGVLDVVYIQYSKNAGSTPAENRPATSPTPSICITGPLRCHTVPTTDLVAAGDTVDGIHPTRAANDRIAAAVLELMETQGIRR
jgi:hypothetical protein